MYCLENISCGPEAVSGVLNREGGFRTAQRTQRAQSITIAPPSFFRSCRPEISATSGV
jgi:hypothetical protein